MKAKAYNENPYVLEQLVSNKVHEEGCNLQTTAMLF